jgi:hypothetical protein
MKKLVVLILCLVIAMSLACKRQPQFVEPQTDPIVERSVQPEAETTAEENPETPGAEPQTVPNETEPPTETPEPAPYEPDLSMLPILYRVDWDRTEADMFTCDIDYDGVEEKIAYRFDMENETAYILVDGEELKFTQCSALCSVILVDLDPETPWVNLLVMCDSGSDDYTTTEVHPENGAFVRGVEKEYIALKDDGTLVSYERTDLLGTKDGCRTVHGEKLEPDSEWLTVYMPTEEKLKDKEERKSLIEGGTLLHLKRTINCRIDGEPAKIKKGTYLYLTRYHESGMLMEVRTEDGRIALIAVDCDPDESRYLINGRQQDKVFDNIFYAD